jgi:RNA polymerase subunit RPABC4/transcription elongation factor Spt4
MPVENIGLALQVVIALFGAFLLAFWLSLIIWTFRDVRSRSRDIFAQLLATLMVIFFNVPGLVLYFMLRPQETLAQAYEKALEEEALLQDIEERYACPGCKKKVQPDFQICPACHTRLKRQCPSCSQLLQLQWNICPYCGATPSALATQPVTSTSAPVASKSAVSRPRGLRPRQPSVTQPIAIPTSAPAADNTRQIREVSRPEIPAPEAYQTTTAHPTDWDAQNNEPPPPPADAAIESNTE